LSGRDELRTYWLFWAILIVVLLVLLLAGRDDVREYDKNKLADHRFGETAIMPTPVRVPEFEMREVGRR
jgi:hypothetical protein